MKESIPHIALPAEVYSQRRPRSSFRKQCVRLGIIASIAIGLSLSFSTPSLAAGQKDKNVKLTLLHIGDTHGGLLPRPDLREGGGELHGGLSRLATELKKIRKRDSNAILFNTGDTLEEGAEALYTSGQSMIDVLDTFNIDGGYTPGNWDFLYGKSRFLELFGAGRWNVVAANVYDADTGQRIVPPYRIIETQGIKIGVIGLTAERGLPAVPTANVGLTFTDGEAELAQSLDELHHTHHVNFVVVLSELGLAKNTLLADAYPGINIIMSSDMHEVTPDVIIGRNGTYTSENGEGSAAFRDYVVKFKNGKLVDIKTTWHEITMNIRPDAQTDALIKNIRSKFVSGPAFRPHTSPISGYVLNTPIDTQVGTAEIGIYRSNFSDDPVPGVIEGTSHNLIADAFRDQAGTDIGVIRGFRYGTDVPPGPIRLQDLYTYLAASAQVARGDIPGTQLKNVIENMIDGALNNDPFQWGGGWLFGFGGVQFDLDLIEPKGSRAKNVMIKRVSSGTWEPLDTSQNYSVAGYYFDAEPTRIGAFQNVANLTVLRKPDNSVMDSTDVVVNYLKVHPANPGTGRIRLLQSLPSRVFGNPEIQPLRGATFH